MARDKHAAFRENIPAYALGTLDAEDIAALEAHLRTCASCRTELAEYRLLSESLLTAIPPKPPSRALRQRLQSRLPSSQPKIRLRRLWPAVRLSMGIAMIGLLILNAYSVAQIRSLHLRQDQLVSQLQTNQTVLAILSYPETKVYSIEAADVTGTFLLDTERNVASFVLWKMPQLDEQTTYQMWLIDSQGDRTSAGLFRPENGQSFTSVSILSQNDLSNFVGIGVTVEPAGGSDHPTGKRIFKVDF